MNLAILGATGRTGREVLTQAAEKGHSLAVLVRHPAKLVNLGNRLRVVQGDASDASAMSQAI